MVLVISVHPPFCLALYLLLLSQEVNLRRFVELYMREDVSREQDSHGGDVAIDFNDRKEILETVLAHMNT